MHHSVTLHRPTAVRRLAIAPLPTPSRPHRSISTVTHCLPPHIPQPSGPEFEENNKKYAELTAKIEAQSATAQENLNGTSIYLIGMMGSGKSTVGKLLSQALSYCFFDTDNLIEQLAGKSIPEIFAQDGEEDFRRIETQVLQELSPFKNCVISTGGGAATKGENWGYMQGGITVWLNGPAELLARRVVGDGLSGRPLLAGNKADDAKNQQAEFKGFGKQPEVVDTSTNTVDMESLEQLEQTTTQLRNLLEQRSKQYSFADLTVSLEDEDSPETGAAPAEVAYRVLCHLNHRIETDAATRQERMKFEVRNENLPPTMEVVKSINPVGGVEEENDPYLP